MAHPQILNKLLVIDLWTKAWGKKWPHQSSGKLTVAPEEDVRMALETDEDHDSADSHDGYSTTAAKWSYTVHACTACGRS